MPELFHCFQLDCGSFIATIKYDDGNFGGWFVPLSCKLEPPTRGGKLDLTWLPSSAVPGRLCLQHHAWWTDTLGCPVCHPRPKMEPVPEPTGEPAVEPAF